MDSGIQRPGAPGGAGAHSAALRAGHLARLRTRLAGGPARGGGGPRAGPTHRRGVRREIAGAQLDAARQTFQTGLDLCGLVVQRDPGSMQKKNDLGIFYTRLAGVAERAEHYAEAARWLGRVAAQCRDLEHNPAANQAVVKNYRQMWERSAVVYKAAAQLGLEDLSVILAQKPVVCSDALWTLKRLLDHQRAVEPTRVLQDQHHFSPAQGDADAPSALPRLDFGATP